MEVVICLIASYLLVGASMLLNDFSSTGINRPIWTFHATFGTALFVLLTWPYRTFAMHSLGNPLRGLVLCSIIGAIHTLIVALMVLAAFEIPHHWIDSTFWSVVIAVPLLLVSSVILFPFASIFMMVIAMPITMIVSLLFPVRRAP